MTKLMKFSFKLPLWKSLEGSEIQIALQQQKFSNVSEQTDVGNGEKHLRQNNLLSWQNILNSGQIATDIEEK